MWKEFREFAVKGNVIDLAVGVIIGGAFGKIVTSLVEDILLPPLTFLTGNVKGIASKFVALDGKDYPTLEAAKVAGAPILAWGSFLNNVLQFLIIAFAVFLIVKAINRVRRVLDAEAAPAIVKEDNAEKQVAQNARMISLLEKIAEKP
ncbi:large conductance mechanosensitive channel [Abditibacterium utsteinense]|uniref:Large-conductance mechanosensitive channel n=1 Tax=Abditibacterium utsteinense TaxID=1960156 RepID=A0A2S8STE9_9BACT|nr:large conductance mechanosensitive channel protein MscL [Abditibacterium utsteinense]PQV64075.1 large conductance mechanosensitive channel [Abditibacterium utsteinense]